MKYIAHKNQETGEEESICVHLEETGKLAEKFAEEFGYGEYGYCGGKLHDIGKYSEGFQKRIKENGMKVDHSTAGAQVCWKKGGLYVFLSYCIAGHHAGLPDYTRGHGSGSGYTLCERMKKKVEDYSAYQQEIKIPSLTKKPFSVKDKENAGFVYSMFIRMLYSCLVDADFLATENFMKQGMVKRDSGCKMELLLERLLSHISGWMERNERNTINGRRTEILKNCLEMGKRERGMYRLTVPTGGGKTISSLAFALCHAVKNRMKRVIYVIPYTSIIEQNAAVFRGILGEENVLENHCNVNYGDGEELNPMQLAAENWDKPVVVTTNVQFFESLFSNKSSKCRKLHNIANSVIIFDEAQMLPVDYLKPCVMAMEQMVRYYRSTVVLCTATQPALQTIISKDMSPVELCPEVQEQFSFFKRVTMKNIGKIEKEDLADALRKEEQALCIVNTKALAQELYEKIKGEGVYHLSTLMYPEHRKRVLSEIRRKLKDKEKCIVISTSLVEAGVDLDFQKVYRQIAGIDSIIQAAGRCNREGKYSKEESVVYVFSLGGEKLIRGQALQISVTSGILEEHQDFSSLDAIYDYFNGLYTYKGESLDKKGILEMFQDGKFRFATAAREFKLMPEETKIIFIPKEEKAKRILQEIRQKGMTKTLMREAQRFCINVYENAFEQLVLEQKVKAVSEEMKEDFFELEDLELYRDDIGLHIEKDWRMLLLM